MQVPEELQDLVWPLRAAQSAVVRYEASRPRGEALRNVLLKDGDHAKAARLEEKIASGSGLVVGAHSHPFSTTGIINPVVEKE